MNKLINGTMYCDAAGGIVAVRGQRELYLLGTSVAQIERARQLLASHSFGALFRKARRAPYSANVAYLKV